MGRPRGIRPTATERAAGFGRTGFCKLCQHAGAPFLAAAIVRAEAEGKPMSANDMLKYMRVLDPEFNADRHGFYKHKADHLTSPLVTAVDQIRQSNGVAKIMPKDNQSALTMIRDLGMHTAIEHPESIGVDHALKAITEMEKKSRGPENLWVMISRMQSGESPELIMGEFKELSSDELEVQEA